MSNVQPKISHIETTMKPKNLMGVRHIQFVLHFMVFFISLAIRANLSIAIIPMTEQTSPDPSIPTYPEWDNRDTILSSFVWGYIIPQIGAGQLSEYFGPKWFLVGTMTISSVFTAAIPLMAATFGSSGVIICRVIQGISQAFLFPCVTHLISRWTPLFERAKISNFVYGGATIGVAASMPITGAISGSKLGWPAVFYIFGAAGIVWAIVFGLVAENSPSTHKTISKEEKLYIEGSNSVTQAKKKIPTPWLCIVTSVPVWAIFMAGNSHSWGSYTLMAEIPSYLNGIMKYDINSNSQLSALPYIVDFFLGLLTSPLSDFLIAKGIIGVTWSRKIFNSLASFIPATALIFLAFLENFDETIVVTLLIVAVGATAFLKSGFVVNMIDIAPNHAGTVFGLINCINEVFALMAPLAVGALGDDKSDPILWRKVFLMAAALYIGCNLFYLIFSSAEVQPWNDAEEEIREEKYNEFNENNKS